MAKANAMKSAEVRKLIKDAERRKLTYARLMSAAERTGSEEASEEWFKKFNAAEDEIYLLIQSLPTRSRAALVKKYGLGWKEK